MPTTKASFSSRHPALFGLMLILAAVIVLSGIMAAFGLGNDDEGHHLFGGNAPRLGVVRIEGTITDAEDAVTFIRKLRRDPSVKGVLLRINSPGGSFGPSQELYMAVKRLAAVKPVVASFSSVAASGGYYAACAATKIYANPGTITGSIGVMTQFANAQDLLQKLGISFESLTSGKLKDAGSPFKPVTPEQRAYLEGLIADLNRQFSGDVAKSRKLSPAAIAAIADARAMTGMRAKQLGLVDVLGGEEDALDQLKKLSALSGETPLLKGPKKKLPILERLVSSLGINADSITRLGLAVTERLLQAR